MRTISLTTDCKSRQQVRIRSFSQISWCRPSEPWRKYTRDTWAVAEKKWEARRWLFDCRQMQRCFHSWTWWWQLKHEEHMMLLQKYYLAILRLFLQIYIWACPNILRACIIANLSSHLSVCVLHSLPVFTSCDVGSVDGTECQCLHWQRKSLIKPNNFSRSPFCCRIKHVSSWTTTHQNWGTDHQL